MVLSPNDEEIAHCLLMLNSDKAGGMVSMLLGILPPVGDLNMFFLDYPMRHTVPRGQRQTGAGPDSRNKILTHGRHMTPEGFLHRFPGSDLPDHPPEGRLVPKPGQTVHVIKQINVISAPVEKRSGIPVDDFRFVMNGFCQFMRTSQNVNARHESDSFRQQSAPYFNRHGRIGGTDECTGNRLVNPAFSGPMSDIQSKPQGLFRTGGHAHRQ